MPTYSSILVDAFFCRAHTLNRVVVFFNYLNCCLCSVGHTTWCHPKVSSRNNPRNKYSSSNSMFHQQKLTTSHISACLSHRLQNGKPIWSGFVLPLLLRKFNFYQQLHQFVEQCGKPFVVQLLAMWRNENRKPHLGQLMA